MDMTVLLPAVTTAATVDLDCGKLEGKAGVLPMLCAGLTYGFTPCAPLLL